MPGGPNQARQAEGGLHMPGGPKQARQKDHTEIRSAIFARTDFMEMNAKYVCGDAALQSAGIYGLTEICSAIFARTAFSEIHAKDGDGRTALYWAADKGHTEIWSAS